MCRILQEQFSKPSQGASLSFAELKSERLQPDSLTDNACNPLVETTLAMQPGPVSRRAAQPLRFVRLQPN